MVISYISPHVASACDCASAEASPAAVAAPCAAPRAGGCCAASPPRNAASTTRSCSITVGSTSLAVMPAGNSAVASSAGPCSRLKPSCACEAEIPCICCCTALLASSNIASCFSLAADRVDCASASLILASSFCTSALATSADAPMCASCFSCMSICCACCCWSILISSSASARRSCSLAS